MDLGRQNQSRRHRYRDPLDRRLDQFLQTGRQFVDGVSGTRPGKRRLMSSGRLSGSSLDKVGRWVGDKLDWLLEDEDDWREPWQSESVEEITTLTHKRPLDAISRRVFSQPVESKMANDQSLDDDSWPDEAVFRVQKWSRTDSQAKSLELDTAVNNNRKSVKSNRRPLPRSSRRRSL